MTTEEFVEAVNDIDSRSGIWASINASVSKTSAVLMARGQVVFAALEKDSINWTFIADDFGINMPTKVLKLMVELAESREEDNKYVILNGKPFWSEGELSTRLFLINEGSLTFCTVNIDDLGNCAHTKENLEQLKATLPKNLQDAVDLLTVTVGEAKKMLKYDN